MRWLIYRTKRAFIEARAWLYVRLRRDVPARQCQSGKCWCARAEQCFFTRCQNCDGCVDANGQHIDTGKWAEPHNRCPDCGGVLQPL